jgi:hypothetical protein
MPTGIQQGLPTTDHLSIELGLPKTCHLSCIHLLLGAGSNEKQLNCNGGKCGKAQALFVRLTSSVPL